MQKHLLRNIIFITSLIIVTGLIILVITSDVPKMDRAVINFIDNWRTDQIMPSVLFITKFGSHTFLIPFTMIACAFLFWLYRSIFPPLVLATGTIAALVINYVLKNIVTRERPQILTEAHAEGFSFPSGHSMIPIVCYGLFMCFLIIHPRTAKWKITYSFFFPALVIIIAMTRLILNVHYLTDVVAGLILGLNIVIIFFTYYQAKAKGTQNFSCDNNKTLL